MVDAVFEHFLRNKKVTTDSRNAEKGAIYFALKGERFNGNQFALSALEKGCAFAIVDEVIESNHPGLVHVEDALVALQNLAKKYRQTFDIPFLAITGSNGKTTTKELITAVLSRKCKTHATKGNLNNHIGVPLTLLSIPEDTEFAVIEMGANHQREIASYCEIALPNFGLITNIGKAHLEGFGGLEGVKKGKKELYDYVSAHGGSVFVNSEIELLREVSAGMKIIPYGFKTEDFNLKVVNENPFLHFEYASGINQAVVHTRMTGSYNLFNFASAIAVGSYFGVAFDDQVAAMEGYDPDNNRSQVVQTENNILIMDAYNANPSSMEHALENLKQQGEQTYFVMGDMRELGDEGPREHLLMLKKAERLELKGITVGPVFHSLKDQSPFVSFETTQEAYTFLRTQPVKGKTVLIKGSRGIRLEELKPLF